MLKISKDTPTSDCEEWLKSYLKEHGDSCPKKVYADGSEKGFSRNAIKAARRYFGKLIETKTSDEGTFWRWSS